MKVVISIIALVLFVLLARFVYLRVTTPTNQPVEQATLPVPTPSYFPAVTPTPTATPTSSARPSASPKPSTATNSGQVTKLPTTGAGELVYLVSAAGIGLVGLKLRKSYKAS